MVVPPIVHLLITSHSPTSGHTTLLTQASSAKIAPTTTKMASESNADLDVGKDPRSAVQDSSRAGTYTIPLGDGEGEMRSGTSSTKYSQQAGTHAAGQLAEGTPYVKIDSQGERQAIMEPNTVGQAPKEHPLPDTEEPPTMVEQAQEMARIHRFG